MNLIIYALWLIAGLVILPWDRLQAQSLSQISGGLNVTPTRPQGLGALWNPALVGYISKSQIETNFAMVGGWLDYQRSGEDPNTGTSYKPSSMNSQAPVPFLAISSPLGFENFRFSYATYFPGGVRAKFSDEGSQRYDLIGGTLLPWHHQLTLAYRPDPHWSIGISGITSIAFFESELDIDMSQFLRTVLKTDEVSRENPALAARAEIPMTHAWGFGGGIGVVWWPTFQWTLGLSFMSPVSYEFDGELNLRTPGIITSMGTGLKALGVEDDVKNLITAKTSLPATLQAGLRYQPFGYWTSEFFSRYIFYSWQKSLSVKINRSQIAALNSFERKGKDLEDAYMLGTVQTFSLGRNWDLGLHLSYQTSAVQDHLLSLTQADFDALVSGLFTELRFDTWSIGAEYSHSFLFQREAKNTLAGREESAFFSPTSTDGTYRASLDRIGIFTKVNF